MLQELEPYIAKYYDRWLRYSEYMCSRFGIRREAYDILMDIMESLCRRPNENLSEFLVYEQQGDPKLFFYVRKAILHNAILFRQRKHKPMVDVENHLFHLLTPTDNDTSELVSNELREAEAKFRDDSFMSAAPASNLSFSVPAIHNQSKKRATKQGGFYLSILYRAYLPQDGAQRKVFYGSTRRSVLAKIIQYQTPHLNE